MHPKLLIFLLSLIFFLNDGFAQSDQWLNGLEHGKYAVGYKALLERDLSRPNISFQNWAGNIEQTPNAEGRPIQIHVWYPAQKAKGKPLPYADYVHQLAQVVDFSPINKERQQWARDWFSSMVNDLGGNGTFTPERLDSLMSLSTKGYRDAPPITSEKFPLVVFVEGIAPATNSAMSEYLASHGYIVASVSMLGTHTSGAEISSKGLVTMTADVQFAIQKVSEKMNVAIGKIALIGLGFNASTCMSVQTLNPAVDAVISLDGGILSNFENEMLNKLPQFDPTAIAIPMLIIHAPHRYIFPETIDYYVHADRYYLNFKQMSEFYFLNFGLFEPITPKVLGNVPGDTQLGVTTAAKSCRIFLDGVFGDQANIEQDLRNLKQQDNISDEFLTISKKEGLPAPPAIALLKNLFLTEGIEAIVAIYEEQKTTNPQPFSNKFYGAFNDWLSWQKDTSYLARKTLAKIRVESFPESALAHYYLGYYAEKSGDSTLAKTGYTTALEKLDADKDLDEELRTGIAQNAKAALGLSTLAAPKAYFSALIVSDLDTALNWYTEVLGFSILNQVNMQERGFRQANLKNSNILIELLEINTSVSKNDITTQFGQRARVDGFFKFGFEVEDFDRWLKHLEEKGASFHGKVVEDPNSSKKMILVLDPDGNRLQFFEQ